MGMNKAFQGIRGYAIILIFFSHYSFMNNKFGINITTWLGALGVEIFILLSGYLLMECHGNDIIEARDYFYHKIKKFYPLHIATLVIALPFTVKDILSLDIKQLLSLASNILLIQAWVPSASFYFGFNSVSWYLSITIFFVLISGMVVKFWNKFTAKKTLFVIGCILLMEFFWCYFAINISISHWLIYIAPFARALDYILGGAYKSL